MHDIGKDELELLKTVLDSRQLMRYRGGEGGYTEKFEVEIKKRINIKHALTMNSGTNALYSAMIAMGIGQGDEVIVPAYTWVASAMAPLLTGAVPVLAEINETLTIDPHDIERKISPYTKAIIPVHMSNNVCDMDSITAIARKHKLLVCEDACQAMGVEYKKQAVGSIGDIGVYSFNMFKNLTCGEGGMLVTDNDKYYERALMLHDAGCYTRDNTMKMDEAFFPGFNFRVSEIQGAILGAQLKKLDSFLDGLKIRRDLAFSILSKSDKFKLSPSNSEGSLAVTLLFENAVDARHFSQEHKVGLLIDSGRHLYSNWEPVMNKAYFDDRVNPHKFAKRKIEYHADMCPVTKDILNRSCGINFTYNMPLSDLEERCKAMVK